jgi:hypothetical protein
MSIRLKVSLIIVAAIVLAAVGLGAYLQTTFSANLDGLAERAVANAAADFEAQETADIAKLDSALQVALTRDDIRELYEAGDKQALYDYVLPLFEQLREEHSITHWYFERPEPDSTVFLRVHNFDKDGDQVQRSTYLEAVETQEIGAGKDLGKTAFALRVVRPWYGPDGELIGYMEFGEEIDHFFGEMKAASGDDFALVIWKGRLDREAYAEFHETRGTEDNWDDHADFVLMDNTRDDEVILDESVDLAGIAPEGVTLETTDVGDQTYARGAFPIFDNAGEQAGVVFVMHDITAVAGELQQTWTTVLIGIVVLGVALLAVILVVLNGLVFRRLDSVVDVLVDASTRLLGGDYDLEGSITPSSNDEIGRFEKFFGDFLNAVAETLKSMSGKKAA